MTRSKDREYSTCWTFITARELNGIKSISLSLSSSLHLGSYISFCVVRMTKSPDRRIMLLCYFLIILKLIPKDNKDKEM